MNYRILGKAVLTVVAWMIGGGIALSLLMFTGITIYDVIKPWAGYIVIAGLILFIIIYSTYDTYKKMIKKDGEEKKYDRLWD